MYVGVGFTKLQQFRNSAKYTPLENNPLYGITITVTLRKSYCVCQALIMEDSSNYDVFSEKDRSEFMFRVFCHITLGGPVNQVSSTCQTTCLGRTFWLAIFEI